MHNLNAPAPPVRTVCSIGPTLIYIGVGCLACGVVFACLPKSEATGYVATTFFCIAFSICFYLSCCMFSWCRPQNNTTVIYGDMSKMPLVMPAHQIDVPGYPPVAASYTSNAASWC